jgi:hypothetical protein
LLRKRERERGMSIPLQQAPPTDRPIATFFKQVALHLNCFRLKCNFCPILSPFFSCLGSPNALSCGKNLFIRPIRFPLLFHMYYYMERLCVVVPYFSSSTIALSLSPLFLFSIPPSTQAQSRSSIQSTIESVLKSNRFRRSEVKSETSKN